VEGGGEVLPQRDGVAEAAQGGHLLDRHIGRLEQAPRLVQAPGPHPGCGAGTGGLGERADERAPAHVRHLGQSPDGQRLTQVEQRPLDDAGDRVVGAARRERALDVLGLPALAVRSHHQLAGHPVRRVGPQAAAHQVQAGVDRRGGTGGREHVTVVDVQDRGVDRDVRVPGGEQVGGPPVRHGATT
jgi:hypothetical protein